MYYKIVIHTFCKIIVHVISSPLELRELNILFGEETNLFWHSKLENELL